MVWQHPTTNRSWGGQLQFHIVPTKNDILCTRARQATRPPLFLRYLHAFFIEPNAEVLVRSSIFCLFRRPFDHLSVPFDVSHSPSTTPPLGLGVGDSRLAFTAVLYRLTTLLFYRLKLAFGYTKDLTFRNGPTKENCERDREVDG